ncbi:MAG: hypothetical protein ACYSTF_02830 [Planctomycetota bacterium]
MTKNGWFRPNCRIGCELNITRLKSQMVRVDKVSTRKAGIRAQFVAGSYRNRLNDR